MATRFYLQSSGTVPISPAFDGAWHQTSQAVRRPMVTVKGNTAQVGFDNLDNGGVNRNTCMLQFVSAPIAAQTILGGSTVKAQIGCRERDADCNAMSQMVGYVVSSDGLTVRGSLVAAHAEALTSEWSTAAAGVNRKFPLSSLVPIAVPGDVVALEGDRIVFEVGARVGDNSVDTCTVFVRDDVGADLPEDETTAATAGDPWIELSADVTFQVIAPSEPLGGIGLHLGIGL